MDVQPVAVHRAATVARSSTRQDQPNAQECRHPDDPDALACCIALANGRLCCTRMVAINPYTSTNSVDKVASPTMPATAATCIAMPPTAVPTIPVRHDYGGGFAENRRQRHRCNISGQQNDDGPNPGRLSNRIFGEKNLSPDAYAPDGIDSVDGDNTAALVGDNMTNGVYL